MPLIFSGIAVFNDTPCGRLDSNPKDAGAASRDGAEDAKGAQRKDKTSAPLR